MTDATETNYDPERARHLASVFNDAATGNSFHDVMEAHAMAIMRVLTYITRGDEAAMQKFIDGMAGDLAESIPRYTLDWKAFRAGGHDAGSG